MGYKVEIMNMGFDALIPALSSGNIDTVIAGMSITPERQEQYCSPPLITDPVW